MTCTWRMVLEARCGCDQVPQLRHMHIRKNEQKNQSQKLISRTKHHGLACEQHHRAHLLADGSYPCRNGGIWAKKACVSLALAAEPRAESRHGLHGWKLGNRSSGTPVTSMATLLLRNSSPRAFQRYLTHLLTPRGSQFTVSWLVHPHP